MIIFIVFFLFCSPLFLICFLLLFFFFFFFKQKTAYEMRISDWSSDVCSSDLHDVMAKPRTLFDKIWQDHLVDVQADGTCLIYIDRHLVHEVTSPQAFEGLRQNGRKVRRPELTLAVADHNIPTSNRAAGIDDEASRLQVETQEQNVDAFEVPYFPVLDVRDRKSTRLNSSH